MTKAAPIICARNALLSGDAVAWRIALAAAEKAAAGGSPFMRGECGLAAALGNLRDLPAFIRSLRAIAPLFGRRASEAFPREFPMLLGADDPLGMHLVRLGDADRTADLLDEAIALYGRLTGGGAGVGALYRAQLAYCRGEFQDAEALAFRAGYLAHEGGQPLVSLAASRILAQTAKHRADMALCAAALRGIDAARNASCRFQAPFARFYANFYRSELSASVAVPGKMPPWIRNAVVANGMERAESLFGELPAFQASRNVPRQGFVGCCWQHALYLLLMGRPAEALEAACALESEMRGIHVPYMLLYIDVLKLCALQLQGRREEADGVFDALMPRLSADGFWVVIAEFQEHLGGYLQRAIGFSPDARRVIGRATRNYIGNVGKIRELINADGLPDTLTERERDVAGLVARGLRNGEVAAELGITERTVKAHLTSVFGKLAIDSRARLIAIFR